MKHIVIDARIIETSTGVYAQRLVHYLHEIDELHRYTILMPSKTIDAWREKYPNFTWVEADEPNYSVSEQLSLALKLYKLKADLVHFIMPQQPLLYIKPSVTTVHDTTLVRYDNIDMNPIIYKIRKAIFAALLRIVCWRSKAIFVPTEFVRKDLMNYIGTKKSSKYVTTLEAGEPADITPEPIEILEGKQYLLFVGNAFPYKNVQRTIQAFAVLKETYPDLHLGLGGKKDLFYEQHEAYVREHKIPDVHFLGRISDEQKHWGYRNAAAYVTASLSEGFHVPLIEAMYEECPVISSNVSCLPEVAGDAALYFDPYSTDELVKVVTQLLEDPELRSELIEKGNARVKVFSWERMTQETYEVYQSVLGSKT